MEAEIEMNAKLRAEYEGEVKILNISIPDQHDATIREDPVLQKTQKESILKRLGLRLGFQSPASPKPGSIRRNTENSEVYGLPTTSLPPTTKSVSSSASNNSLESNNKPQSLLKKISAAILPNAPDLELDIDKIISNLKRSVDNHGNGLCVSAKDIKKICGLAREITLAQPTLLQITAPILIGGDIHGQFSDLLRIFEKCGDPSTKNYLFLGDYVDRGKKSLETILLLQCYKIKYPETFFLLRGNHETSSVNRVYGFFDECKRRCSYKIWKHYTDFFNVFRS